MRELRVPRSRSTKRARGIPRAVKAAKPVENGRRVWMSRGMRVEHHEALRKIAAFLPKDKPWGATISRAHDVVLEAGLPIVMERLGIPQGPGPELPPAA